MIKTRPLSIMVVEDDPVSQLIVQGVLGNFDYECELVPDGEQAVARWHQMTFDLILMDCHLPGIDGWEVTRIIRADPTRGTNVQIHALTASDDPAELGRCLASGMNGYLKKPIIVAELGRVLRDCLSVPTSHEKGPIIDFTKLGERFAGLEHLAKNVQLSFLAQYPILLSSVEDAIRSGNPQALNLSAHTVRGIALALSAQPCADAAYRLERMGCDNNLHDVEPAWLVLRTELARLAESIDFCLRTRNKVVL